MEKQNRARNILKHLGSAHTKAELAALMLTGQEKLPAEQPEPDFDPDTSSQPLTAGNDSRRNESAVAD